jgi:hypothetical protein
MKSTNVESLQNLMILQCILKKRKGEIDFIGA